MKHRCAKISKNAVAVDSELKTAARVERQIETDWEASWPQPFTSKKMGVQIR